MNRLAWLPHFNLHLGDALLRFGRDCRLLWLQFFVNFLVLPSRIIGIQAMMGQRGSRGIAPLFYLTSALDGVVWSTPSPGRFTPGKNPVPTLRRLGGSQSRPGLVRKISPTPAFDPRTVQPVESRYQLRYPDPRGGWGRNGFIWHRIDPAARLTLSLVKAGVWSIGCSLYLVNQSIKSQAETKMMLPKFLLALKHALMKGWDSHCMTIKMVVFQDVTSRSLIRTDVSE